MTKYSIIFAIVLLLCNSALVGQSFSAKIRRLSIEDGLSNRFVRNTFQDSKGFIWLATNYGLNRYDGYSFRLLTKEKEGLANNVIDQIYEDKDSCLWVTFLDTESRPFEQVSIININTLKVESLTDKFGASFPIKEYDIFDIYQAAPNVLFIVTKSRQVFEYKGNGACKKLFDLPHANHTLSNILFCKHAIWVIGMGYILEYDKDGNLQEEDLLPFKDILDVRCDGDQILGYAKYLQQDSLFYFSKKVSKPVDYNPASLTFKKEGIYSSVYIRQAPNGLIWFYDETISKIYTAKGELVYDFTNLLLRERNHSIFSIFFDNDNNSWIATTDGVYLFTVEPNKFHTYLNQDEFVPTSKGYSIRGIIEEGGFLYVNTYSGRQKINLQTGDVIHLEDSIKPIKVGENRWPELDAIKDQEGNLWFCGQTNDVQCLDPKTGVIKTYPTKHAIPVKEDFYEEMNLKLYQDSYGRMWMGTNGGLYYLDTTYQAFIKYNAYGFCEQLNTSMVYALMEDTANNTLWAGTTSGLYKFDYKLGRFTYHYGPEESKAYYIPHDYILTIHKDRTENILWLGTHEGGLIKFHPEDGYLDHFTVATGLSDNVIYAILEDDNGFLWMSSNYGLMRFNKKTYWSAVYLPRDGITTEEFNKMAWHQSSSGRFYFGGVNGIVAFYPNHFQEEGESYTPMYILSYECLSGQAKEMENRTAELLRTKEIVLSPNDHFFKLSFALLDYEKPSQNRYMYKIEDSGQGWQYTSENEVRINRLPYGNYALIIKGQGTNGEWSNNEIYIPIRVKAPFYKTIPFFVGIAILFIFIVLGGARISVRNSQKNKKYLEREIATRTQKLLEREQDLLKAKEEAEKSSHAKAEFLSIMSHEIRTPMNAVVNLTNYLLEDDPAQRQVENLNILKFSANNLLAILNDVLDFNKIESGKVEFEAIEFDLLGLLDSIHYGMSANARKKNINFFLDAEVNLSQMLVGDPNRLTQILNNLISNAIKFTEKGQVKLTLSVVEQTDQNILLRFAIADTGIGISEEEKKYIFNMFTQAASDTTRKYGGTGLGLAITKRLLQLQNSDIELESTVGKGSIFSFELGFGKGASLAKERVLGAPKERLGKELKGAKVLVVEDNTVNVLVVQKFLEKWGVDFFHAEDGLEAVKKVDKQQFDLVLMDIHMPNMDGYVATEIIRAKKDGHYNQIPIIALTASALMDNKERIYEAGMNDIVVKPFKPAELYKVLAKYLVKKI
ncbi:response regulator [Aureispira sp. CCB-E]|uniref:hybrid sensor histidine kinase/response regulator n=1 Tax=Aureispira sp. CCB-E TaxID=3051121 RepID=UPI00286971DC|nr:response regulator [Aureispira sp. CCB-E]WMX17299.1 response regulator [Aureispira sp. CCB-E]